MRPYNKIKFRKTFGNFRQEIEVFLEANIILVSLPLHKVDNIFFLNCTMVPGQLQSLIFSKKIIAYAETGGK